MVPQIVLPEQVPGMLPPPKIFEAAVATGVAKAESPFMKILVKGILAGAYISVGAAVLLTVGGNCAGGYLTCVHSAVHAASVRVSMLQRMPLHIVTLLHRFCRHPS